MVAIMKLLKEIEQVYFLLLSMFWPYSYSQVSFVSRQFGHFEEAIIRPGFIVGNFDSVVFVLLLIMSS